MATYQLTLVRDIAPCPREDAAEWAVRVTCDGDYWQFFNPWIDGVGLHAVRVQEGREWSRKFANRFYAQCVELSFDHIEGLIRAGFSPGSQPKVGERFVVDEQEADRRVGDHTPELGPISDYPIRTVVV